jgi:hypothetical protein
MTKLKIGDTYSYTGSIYVFTVLDIIFEETVVSGNWPGFIKTKKIKNCYFSICDKDNQNYYTKFSDEDDLIIIKSSGPSSPVKVGNGVRIGSLGSRVGNCPRCGGELKDHMSFGLGEMIKKCSNPDCGWC